MNAAQSDSPKQSRTILRLYAQQIIVSGLAFSLTLLVELLGRDSLAWQSYWAVILFSIAFPMWLLVWTVERQLEHVQGSQSESWNDKFSSWFSTAFALTAVAAGLELYRVIGFLIIGFEIFMIWIFLQLRRLVEDHSCENLKATESTPPESKVV